MQIISEKKYGHARTKKKLIDSIIQNIDIPKIYLARTKGKERFDYECIDGKQRMATLLNFFNRSSPGTAL